MVDLKKFSINTKQKQSKRFVETELDFKKKNGKFDISSDDVLELIEGIENEARDNNQKIKIMVRGLNIDKWVTLKSYYNDANIKDDEDYYAGKVADDTKFEKFANIKITVRRQKNILI